MEEGRIMLSGCIRVIGEWHLLILSIHETALERPVACVAELIMHGESGTFRRGASRGVSGATCCPCSVGARG